MMQNQAPNCKFYGSMIGCRYGNKCRYNHLNPNSVPLCNHYNNCRFGNNCKFRHINFNTNTNIKPSNMIKVQPIFGKTNSNNILCSDYDIKYNYKCDHHLALETEMLFTGYTKENYNGYVPIVLIRLFCTYFEQIFYWTLKGKQLNKFLDIKQNKNIRFDSKIIKWSPITFQFHLFPNKSWLNNKKYVGFCWRIIDIPEWIKKIHVEYKMYCIDTSVIANDRVILLNDNNICSIGHGWNLNVMKLPNLYTSKSMTFACFIHCKYNEDAKDDIDTVKRNQNVPLPNDGYRKLVDKLHYTIK